MNDTNESSLRYMTITVLCRSSSLLFWEKHKKDENGLQSHGQRSRNPRGETQSRELGIIQHGRPAARTIIVT